MDLHLLEIAAGVSQGCAHEGTQLPAAAAGAPGLDMRATAPAGEQGQKRLTMLPFFGKFLPSPSVIVCRVQHRQSD